MGKSIKEFHGEIIAWKAPTHFGLHIPAPAYSSEAHFRISPKGPTRSTVDYSIDITLHKTFARLLSPLMRVPLTFFVRKQIGRLKVLCGESAGKPGGALNVEKLPAITRNFAPAAPSRRQLDLPVAGTLTPPGGQPPI